jgi:NAD(P)H dehydrogenase (quinone)
VRDLYEVGFDPVLRGTDFEAYQSGKLPWDIKVEQDEISWADFITFVYPIWWTGIPAVLKGYFDRVFSYGFAYAIDENGELQRLLSGKRVAVFNTHGQPWDLYTKTGMYDAMNKTSDTGIFEFTGMKVEARWWCGIFHSMPPEIQAPISPISAGLITCWR